MSIARSALILLFVLPSIAFAQSFKGGVQGGFAMSQVDGDRYAGFHKTGLWAELFVEYPLTKKAGLHLGLAGIQKGSYKKFNELEFYRINLIYTEFPVLLVYRITPHSIIEGGLGLGMLVHSAEKNELGPLSKIDSPAFNTFELSAQGGIKYFIWTRAGGTVKLSYSLLPIRDTKQISSYGHKSGQYNNLIQFSLFYML